jgi:ArsR family transcriptional regulator
MLLNPVSNPLQIDLPKLKKAALCFRAINNDYRYQILQLIHKHQRLMVTDIYVKLRSDQSKTSVHLAILRNANLVKAEREGKSVFYSLNYRQVRQLHSVAETLLNE